MIGGTSLFEPQHPETKKDDTLLNGKGFLLITLFVQGVVMILANTIFMTARIALDRVPDAFAFFVRQVVWQRHLNNPCPPVLLWRQAASLTLSVTSSGTSAVVRNFWFIRLNWFLENRVFRVPAFVPKV